MIRQIDLKFFPLEDSENWFISSPNSRNVYSFKAGSLITCQKNFDLFVSGKKYLISDVDPLKGFVLISSGEEIISLPFYLVARFFNVANFLHFLPREEIRFYD